MTAIVWFGISMGCVDALDVCEKATKVSCVGASGESMGAMVCKVPEVN
jgi:hypothetical protein